MLVYREPGPIKIRFAWLIASEHFGKRAHAARTQAQAPGFSFRFSRYAFRQDNFRPSHPPASSDTFSSVAGKHSSPELPAPLRLREPPRRISRHVAEAVKKKQISETVPAQTRARVKPVLK